MLLPPFKRILYILIFHSNTMINKLLPFSLHLPLLLCSIGISDMTMSSYIILRGRPLSSVVIDWLFNKWFSLNFSHITVSILLIEAFHISPAGSQLLFLVCPHLLKII